MNGAPHSSENTSFQTTSFQLSFLLFPFACSTVAFMELSPALALAPVPAPSPSKAASADIFILALPHGSSASAK